MARAGGWLLASALTFSASTAVAAPRIAVEVALEDLSSGELQISILIEGNEDPHLRLRGVPTYVDNPVAEARGEVVRALRVSSGQEDLAVRWSEGERGEPGWSIAGAGTDVLVEYTLRVDFVAGPMVEAYPIQIPSMDARRTWLTGNHVFLTPEFSEDRVADLRVACPVAVSFVLPPELELFGPPARTELRNLHELLALQFGIGEFQEIPVEGGPWPGGVVFRSAEEFTPAEQDFLVGTVGESLRRSCALFGGAPFPAHSVMVFRSSGMGGLEGAWACQAYVPVGLDLTDSTSAKRVDFQTVVAHEVVHTWLPITLFAAGDPWLKEGVTSYYGNVLAARAGWMGPARVAAIFDHYPEQVLDAGLEPVFLSDARIWYEEYNAEAWRRVTYDRGHAVAALLDVFLREESGHRSSLDAVLRELFACCAGTSFSRADLLGVIEAVTGVDASQFFARYVDTTSAPTAEAVAAMHRKAIEYGIYAAD